MNLKKNNFKLRNLYNIYIQYITIYLYNIYTIKHTKNAHILTS